MKKLLVLVCVLMLTGCAGIQQVETNVQADLAKVQAIAVPDLQAALADATAHNDTAAANCYTALLGVIKANPPTLPNIKGVASGFQVARDAIGGSAATDLAKQVNIGCAALFVDATITVGKIAASFGVGGLPALPLP